MKKRKVNALLAIVLSLTMLVGVAGCGKEQQLEAEINRTHLQRKCSFH